ncbi:MAG: RNA-binding S4 domain-containing protein [Pseudanabaena sp. ELA607]|jgi:ribosome-associated protein
MHETFAITGDYIALCDLIKVCGITDTGGLAKQFIAQGNVKVDGQMELRKACKIRAGQRVSGAGFVIEVVAP